MKQQEACAQMKIMKFNFGLNGLLCALLVSTLAGCGGSSGGGGGNSSGQAPVATAVGTPNGTATTETIGAAGGTVSTPDGKITVTIPAGALTADTEIGIQPLTDTAQGGVGSGYRLTPEGQVFNQPVELTFEYDDTDLEGSDPEALDVATQITGGYWQWIEGAVVDEGNRTVTLTTTHFSDWSLVTGYKIKPLSASVKGGLTVSLEVVFCHTQDPEPDPNGGDELAYLGLTCDSNKSYPVSNWSVNGVAGGNGTIGTVSGNGATATYTAPNEPPTPNTVTVSADVNAKSLKTGKPVKTVVISNITITGSEISYDGNLKFSINALGGLDITGTAVVTWTQFEDLGDVKSYLPTGTITADIQLSDCDLLHTTVPILTSTPDVPAETLVVYTNLKKYQFALVGDGPLNFSCGGESVPLDAKSILSVFICPDIDQIPSYVNEDELAVPESSPATCSIPGSSTTASWSFKIADNLAPLN